MRRYRSGFWGFFADLHQDYRYEIAGMFFALGLLLVFFAILGYVPQARAWAQGVGFLAEIVNGMGPWIFWEAIVAALVMIIGLFDFWDTLKKTLEFEKLMNTTSKEVFLKNRKRIKHLAENDLPERYWHRVLKKEAELRIAK